MACESLVSGWRGRRRPLVQATAEADAQLCESLVSGLPQGRRRAFCAQAGAGPQRGVQRRVGCPSRGAARRVRAALNLRARMAWCSELLAFSSSSLSDDHGPGAGDASRSRRLRGPVLADRRDGGAGPQRRVYTAVRADSGANDTTRAAGSTPTRQPRARGSRSDGWPSSTALICGVQASDRDPAGARLLWLLDARPAAAQDSEEEARTASDTRKTGTP